MRTNKFVYRMLALFVIAATVLTACGGGAATEAPSAATELPPAEPSSVMDTLAAACKEEGMVTIIGTPDWWANYGEIFQLFKDKSGAELNSLDENAGSADEIAAVEANKDNKGPQAPDILDVGYAYGKIGIEKGIYMPYKVSTWDKIPDTLLGLPAKDPDGYWTGGYYGVMVIETNTAVVQNPPKNWEDRG